MMTETKTDWMASVSTSDGTCCKHGGFIRYRVADGDWSGCPTCADEAEKEERERKYEEDQARFRREAWVERMNSCGIPKRFRDRSFENFVADSKHKKEALDFSKAFAVGFKESPGKCAVFVGKPGTGKTHLSVAIGLHLLNNSVSVRFCTAIRAIRRIKESWGKNAEETESQAVNSLVWPQLLILDEVGVQFGSDAEKMLLFDVMNERYEQQKSTIILSNLSLEEVKEYLGERVFDRMREDGGRFFVFDWESHRGKK